MMTNRIKLLTPAANCPITSARPEFTWAIQKAQHLPALGLNYRVRVVPLKEGQVATYALRYTRPVLSERVRGKLTLPYPEHIARLKPGGYAAEVRAYGTRGRLVGISKPRVFYVEDPNMPISLRDLLCCGENHLADQWKIAYGQPSIQTDTQGGLPGKTTTLTLYGNASSGDAVYHVIDAKFKAGKRYAIRLCARFLPKQASYVRLRLLAFNGTLPTSGQHPATNENIAIISETGPINHIGWSRLLLPGWRATREYEALAIVVLTDGDMPGYVDVADVCLAEIDHCGPLVDVPMVDGNISVPASWEPYLEAGEQPSTVDVAFDQGAMVDRFGPMFDDVLGNSNWNFPDPCASLGGELPPEATDSVKEKEDFNIDGITADEIEEAMKTVFAAIGKLKPDDLSHLEPIEPDVGTPCHAFEPNDKLPFGGRDIIYVHGVRPDHVVARIARQDDILEIALQQAQQDLPPDTVDDILALVAENDVEDNIDARWPADRVAFAPTGLFRREADEYWHDHIETYLGEPASNRYLIVGYNTNQRLVENVHAVLTQISQAMNSGEGVVDNGHPLGTDCFGRDFVVVAHSAGAMVTNVAMSLAARTASSAILQSFFGDISYIPQRCAAHISLHGAIAGSELAALAVAGANGLAQVVAPGIDTAIDMGIDFGNTPPLQLLRLGLAGFGIDIDTTMTMIGRWFDNLSDELVVLANAARDVVNKSIWMDLIPVVAKLMWGAIIANTPVPVLTVAGGHPSAFMPFKWVLAGFDDGVVNTCSQSGSPSLIHPDRYFFLPLSDRLYDMGKPVERSSIFYAEQYDGSPLAAYGSTPYLSPMGMVQPVDFVFQPLPRFRNHFTFLQSASEHNAPLTTGGDYESTPTFSPPGATVGNFEETLVIEEPGLFGSNFNLGNPNLGNPRLINPAIQNLVFGEQRRRDLVITLRFPVPVFTPFPPSFTIQWVTFMQVVIPIWQRDYRRLRGDFQHECEYVYEFVLR